MHLLDSKSVANCWKATLCSLFLPLKEMLPPRTLAEVPAPSAICPRRKSEQAGRRRLEYDRELPSQVDELCTGHPCHRANPRNRKMNHNCQKSWNGENRVVQHLPELLIAWVLGLWYRNWYYNDKCRNVVGVNLHTIKKLPRRKWQAIATVRLNGLDYSKKEPDTKCKSVCLN